MFALSDDRLYHVKMAVLIYRVGPWDEYDISLVSGEIDCDARGCRDPRIHQSDKQSVTVSEGPGSSRQSMLKMGDMT